MPAKNPLSRLSVIVPLSPREQAWTRLVHDLQALPAGAELLFVGPKPPAGRVGEVLAVSGSKLRIAWVRSPLGRAKQLNRGIRSASNDFLWFLHADTRFSSDTVPALERALLREPDALLYFDLGFYDGAPFLMTLTERGVSFRSHVLGLPFGDQAFCVARDVALRVGGFDEKAPYGEDHLFVWQAARAGVPLRCTDARVLTSARKYQAGGWLKTTLMHQMLTYQQALPELWKQRKLPRS